LEFGITSFLLLNPTPTLDGHWSVVLSEHFLLSFSDPCSWLMTDNEMSFCWLSNWQIDSISSQHRHWHCNCMHMHILLGNFINRKWHFNPICKMQSQSQFAM
jgi:hypothetical protein